MLGIALMARFVPYKLAPAIFPRELLTKASGCAHAFADSERPLTRGTYCSGGTACASDMLLGVRAEPAMLQCVLGTLPYRYVFREIYSVMAVLAAVCLVPAARLLV